MRCMPLVSRRTRAGWIARCLAIGTLIFVSGDALDACPAGAAPSNFAAMDTVVEHGESTIDAPISWAAGETVAVSLAPDLEPAVIEAAMLDDSDPVPEIPLPPIALPLVVGLAVVARRVTSRPRARRV